jgi:hypothetical protein
MHEMNTYCRRRFRTSALSSARTGLLEVVYEVTWARELLCPLSHPGALPADLLKAMKLRADDVRYRVSVGARRVEFLSTII